MLFWRVMLVLLMVMMVCQSVSWLLNGGLSMLQWLLLCVAVLLFFPACGYAYNYPIVPRWYAIVCACILFVTFQFSLATWLLVWMKHPQLSALLPLMVHLCVVMIFLYPVWQYAFKSPQLWQAPKGTTRMRF
ncbi:hypothetical protein [Ferrimonas pelagia]|uniref:Uncharacterized protein n=1 Tax=Ferrimonas pelagia TaxID=1177826 RepID=A0ABP9EKH4_9GAMM